MGPLGKDVLFLYWNDYPGLVFNMLCFLIFRKLFLEGCAPQPIAQEQDDPISEDSASDKEYKSKKKKKKGMAGIE